MIDEDTGKLTADCLVEQNCCYRRIDTAAESEDYTVVANLSLEFADGTLDESVGTPVLMTMAYIDNEVLEQQRTLKRMEDLGMELCAEYWHWLGTVGVSSLTGIGDIICSIMDSLGRCHHMSALRHTSDAVAMRHPHLRIVVEATEQRALLVDKLKILTSVFASASTLDLAAIDVAHILSTIADAKDRQTTTDAREIDMEGIVGINTERRAR